MPLVPNTHLGRYEIRSKLGEGGMGEVYLAEDSKLNRKVAIKFLPPELIASEQANRRLLREARAAANLDHPNICAVHEVGEEDGRSFIVMQYVEGDTLGIRMKRKPLDLSESLALATQVADALTEAHTRGIIHRDIKPSNIMITPRGVVKVMDFGLAKIARESVAVESDAETQSLLTTPGAIIGTVPYMSPEQVRGEQLDARTDIFSFGVVLYEMISGRQPFFADSTAATISAIMTHEQPPLARYSREAPPELERIVSKALRKDRDERYQTAKDLLLDLRSLKDDLHFEARLERSTPPDASSDRGVLSVPPASAGGSHQDLSEPPAVAGGSHQVPHQAVLSVPPALAGGSYQAARPTSDDETSTHETTTRSIATPSRRTASRRIALAVIAALLLLALAAWFYRRSANLNWARDQVPRIEQLAQDQKYFEAYDLAIAAQQYLPNEATITRLMPTISDTLSVTTEPAGAQVYLKRFSPDESGKFPPRELVGTTPINNLRIARGQYILYIEKYGYGKTERTLSGAIMRQGNSRVILPPLSVQEKLIEAVKMPERMVFVPGGDYRLVAWARPTEERVRLDDYFIDKYEVSNQEYKEFINAGGYLKRQYWKYPFVKDGKTLSWEAAIKEFKDGTGLPGPRNWSNQNFPEGKAEYPVTDVTWYEAAAFAAFRGKQLPTIFQWEKAARNGNLSPLGNYMPWGIFYPGDTLTYHANFENNGTMPVSSSEFGMSPFGSYNMAGNVAEWCLNEISQGFIASGGRWGEPSYMFAFYGTLPGFYSSNNQGFRCALNSPGATGDQGAMRIEIKEEIPVYAPSSDASFNNWLNYYRYDKTPLDPQIVEVTETGEWRREKITFNGADGERAIAYLYLPKNLPLPLQVVHFMPASNVQDGLQPLTAPMANRLAPIIKSGRAAFGVVIKGYIERLRPDGYTEPDPRTVEYREKIVNWITDLRRGLDYLETRDDLDTSRIALLGASAGALSGLILAAVETRYRSVAWLGAGVRKSWVPWIAEANPINFAPHIRAPKLMVHGRYDETLPLKTQAEPLYKLLREPKRLVLYDGGHTSPMEFFVPTMNSWLDETLGPVKRE